MSHRAVYGHLAVGVTEDSPEASAQVLAEIQAAGWTASYSADGQHVVIDTWQVYVDDAFVGYAPTEDAAEDMAQAACVAAHEGPTTMWFDVCITPPEGADREYDIAVPPPVPRCPGRDAHEWVPGRIVGDGGGVGGTDECAHCGVRHQWTTWGTRPDTGAQGYRVSRYEGGGR
ncbi:MAG: hypothetical protein ACRC4O_10970 [Giesbergeria sp.]